LKLKTKYSTFLQSTKKSQFYFHKR